MASLSVTELKPGVKLLKDVHTPLGGLLLPKGTVLLPRSLDILRAFMVQNVEVEDNGISKDKSSSKSPSVPSKAEQETVVLSEISLPSKTTFLYDEYDKMVQLIKSVLPAASAGNLPIYELRNQLESLTAHIKDYNLLTFTPRTMNEYDYMYHNAVLCALSSYVLSKWVGLQQKDWMQAAFAGLFHDIGKTKIDPAVLFKPQQLSPSENEEMRKHTTYGYQLLKNVTAINEGVRLAALQHHEKVDGTGYPLRLEGNKIHTYAKIVGVVDIYHAMTLNRIYRKSQSPYMVLEQIQSEAFGKLDPAIVQTFIHKATELHHGTLVRLNNDQIGEIVFTDRDHPTRPMVSVNGQIVNLMQQRQLYINEVIKQG